jgi:hypothetical protein
MQMSQLDLIMSQVQQLSASDQLQIIKRVADLLEHPGQSPRNEEQLAAMAADPAIQRESETEAAGTEMGEPEPSKSESQPFPNAGGMVNGEVQRPDAVREMARAASLRDFTADRQWLKEHCDEYAGQWVALKYGQLISHGPDLKAVHAAAQAAGHPDALLELVEPRDALPFIL